MAIIKQFSTTIPVFTRTIYRHYSPIFHSSSKEKSLNVTDSAFNRLRVLKQKFPEKILRIAVEAGGCHGFQYKFSLDGTAESTESDTVFGAPSEDELRLNCDNVSWSMIKDAKLDYSNELIGSAFRIIDNPVADSGCGCGVSFDLKSNKD